MSPFQFFDSLSAEKGRTILIGRAVAEWCIARMAVGGYEYVDTGNAPPVIVLDGDRGAWARATAYDRRPGGGLVERWSVGPRPVYMITPDTPLESYGCHFTLYPEGA